MRTFLRLLPNLCLCHLPWLPPLFRLKRRSRASPAGSNFLFALRPPPDNPRTFRAIAELFVAARLVLALPSLRSRWAGSTRSSAVPFFFQLMISEAIWLFRLSGCVRRLHEMVSNPFYFGDRLQ